MLKNAVLLWVQFQAHYHNMLKPKTFSSPTFFGMKFFFGKKTLSKEQKLEKVLKIKISSGPNVIELFLGL